MTPETLLKIMPGAGPRASVYADPLTKAMDEFSISTPKRQAAFLAQVCHESGSLRYTEEIASGSAYEGRVDLGNTQAGDGIKYKGRGLIQLTGRANYIRCGDALGINLVESPSRLAEVALACQSAGWFWWSNRLNEEADRDRFGMLTKLINGGYNGLDDRILHWLRARKVLGL